MSQVFLQNYGSTSVAFIKIHRQWLPIPLFIISVVITKDATGGLEKAFDYRLENGMWCQGVAILDTLLSTHMMAQQHGWSKVPCGTSRLVQPLEGLLQATLKLLSGVSVTK